MKQSLPFGRIRRYKLSAKNFLLPFMILFVSAIFTATVNGQAIYVDKVDYMPGDTVKLSGYAWQPGEKRKAKN